ncbi:hypothetical protein [Methylobacterium sp. E-045]|uniref:hypothetical protein n=1 Tax=Methylobacterium sp. E-045 TaxID=2836575 RepID=UPI001FBA0868|nr:hypothetical protein [Methylobacterium sp. E-045]MCJ2127505.1 hypothetical protein [Methylobacterium sp. E-045]
MISLEPSVLPAPPADPSGLIAEAELLRLMARHERLACLCDHLEACADILPTWPVEGQAKRLRAALSDFIMHEAQSSAFVAEMFGPGLQNSLAAVLLRHVEARRTNDLVHAEDLMAVLDVKPGAAGRISADTLAYMLRCFFAACRQRMAFEILALLMLAQHRLTPGGRSLLVDSLSRRAA